MSLSQTIGVVTSGCGIRPAVSGDVLETAIAEIYLADVDAVAVLRIWPVNPAVVGERNVGRARTGAGLQANAEEPIIQQVPRRPSRRR